MSDRNYHHLSLEERKCIESYLNVPDITLKRIAKIIRRSPKCVREEIKSHRRLKIRANQHNKCGRQNSCDIRRLCTHCLTGLCKGCTHDSCNDLCSDFTPEPDCPRTNRFPYVCSNCPDIDKCKMPKFFYIASIAQSQYEHDKTVWREGPRKTDAEMKRISEALQEGIRKKQSVDVIVHTNNLPVSTSTAYKYISHHHIAGIVDINLKRKVRYKPRRQTPQTVPLDYDWLNGRRFEDFLDRIDHENNNVNIWEMDTVMGAQCNEKCILSLLHRKSNLQLYFLLNNKTMLEVNRTFDAIKFYLGTSLFRETFTIILTDNGSEFHDPLSIETDPQTGEKLIDVYYARPRRSDDKGKCEKNHEHFRECVPKGASMDSLSKKDVNYVSNMVNNYPRRKFNYNSPYELALLFLNEKVLELNRLKHLSKNVVDLHPIIH